MSQTSHGAAGTLVAAGTWVEIQKVLLQPQERASNVPDDTRATPFVMRVRGFLDADGIVGEQVSVTSLIGRVHEGILIDASPAYEHSFGPVVPELLHIGRITEREDAR
ncbi:2-amino-4-oxopentanoate thiolase subunit OrtA [Gephyromycinifex aptenodytis]|uniref:2-amino-4-oxopentanoate thiolase subunit OrtA n=1 Tax=Gephyromycinifex aptenodytis TaxID=2716227 RepID=UPI0014474983|nr:2-amino-4-oxopentanoate thiolase subunit OrtA [Gephyromycinifex aptenodytis]